MEKQRNPQDARIPGPDNSDEPVTTPQANSRIHWDNLPGDLEIEFEYEVSEEGGEA